jgi:hypothetical protein
LSIASTALIYVGIPLVVIALVASIVMSGSDRTRRARRYRPGRPYDFQPIWFLASPERVTQPAATGHAPALEAPIFEDSSGVRARPGPVGGASDSW